MIDLLMTYDKLLVQQQLIAHVVQYELLFVYVCLSRGDSLSNRMASLDVCRIII